MRLKCVVLLGLVLLAGCSKQAVDSQAGVGTPGKEEIYFVMQVITVDTGTVHIPITQRSFSGITVSKQSDGTQTMHQRTLWSRQVGNGSTSGTLGMDPDDTDGKQVLALLASGFNVTVDKDGGVKEIRAVDQQAFSALVQRRPEAAAMFTPQSSNAGLRPIALPDRLSVGQEFTRQDHAGSAGAVGARMRVTALTDDVAVVDVQVEGEGVSGGGQQAIRRQDGMPIEMQFELRREAKDGQPASTVRLSAINMAQPPELEIEADANMYRINTDFAKEAFAKPPFSAPSDDASLYRLITEKEGELAPWMLSPAALDQIDKHIYFGALDEHNTSRPVIAIGGKLPAVSSKEVGNEGANGSDADRFGPFVMAQLHKATLLDAAGRELPGLTTVPVHAKIMFMDEYRKTELDADFPFRLPLQTRAEQLTSLETLRLDIGVEAYTWAGSETVKVGAQSKDNAQVRIKWTGPQRVTLEQNRTPFGTRQGKWTVAVPVDAEGRQIPSAIIEMASYLDNSDSPRQEDLPPLSWSHRTLPINQDIAASQPIAALQLRHYNWEQLQRQWNLRNARNVPEPGKQGGQ
ncbi:hypothetical protein FXN63_12330 [Pigmentiphaga aceris]|uniref:Uncharacterized protein n=1 Tax=Pigmentiphaga aceris TaxID=1940612 RepID=A0A5C0B087_9BURK|nr:hypothetical protein [Pigmentiphaga aceris]QEI06530.1 hypothetical protein FXN63_12330 [Pigmentiphaga aceris]